jgi:hypothetical protein
MPDHDVQRSELWRGALHLYSWVTVSASPGLMGRDGRVRFNA